MNKQFKILNIKLEAASIDKIISLAKDTLSKKLKMGFSFTGAHGLIESRTNKGLKEALLKLTNCTDGMPTVWYARSLGLEAKRVYGPDFMREALKHFSREDHILYGSSEDTLRKLKDSLISEYKVTGNITTISPPFRELTSDERNDYIREIKNSNAKIIWVGLSTPKQEIFAARLLEGLDSGLIFCVGAAFDFLSHNKEEASAIIKESGLQWLYRLLKEPKRLAPRYFKIVPFFMFLALSELILKKLGLKKL